MWFQAPLKDSPVQPLHYVKVVCFVNGSAARIGRLVLSMCSSVSLPPAPLPYQTAVCSPSA